MKGKMITDSEEMHFFTTESGRNVVAYGWMTTLSTSPDDVLSADIGVLFLDVGVFVSGMATSHCFCKLASAGGWWEANRPALFRLSSSCLTSLQSQSVNVSSKTRCSCGDQLKFTRIRFCRAPREDPKAMAEHICPFFLPQSSSKLPTSTTTVQNECELKSAPICSPRRQFGAKFCEYVPLPSEANKLHLGRRFSQKSHVRLQMVFFFCLFTHWSEN